MSSLLTGELVLSVTVSSLPTGELIFSVTVSSLLTGELIFSVTVSSLPTGELIFSVTVSSLLTGELVFSVTVSSLPTGELVFSVTVSSLPTGELILSSTVFGWSPMLSNDRVAIPGTCVLCVNSSEETRLFGADSLFSRACGIDPGSLQSVIVVSSTPEGQSLVQTIFHSSENFITTPISASLSSTFLLVSTSGDRTILTGTSVSLLTGSGIVTVSV